MLPPVVSSVVFPLIGTVICNCLWLTPLPVVLEARYTRYLGPINPYPFALIAIAQLGWTIYGCMKKDIFIFLSSFLGVPFGCYYTIVCLTVIAKRDADSDFSSLYLGVEYFLLAGFLFWTIIGFVAAAAFENTNDPLEHASSMVGTICCTLSVAYYTSPMTSLLTVLKEQDSSSLFLPLLCINLLNASMWFFYGLFSTKDVNILVPNGIGIGLSIFQITLRILIPVKATVQTQTFEHVLHLIQGKIPPTFVTSEHHIAERNMEQEEIWTRERSMSLADRLSSKLGFNVDESTSMKSARSRARSRSRSRSQSSPKAKGTNRDIEEMVTVLSPIPEYDESEDAP